MVVVTCTPKKTFCVLLFSSEHFYAPKSYQAIIPYFIMSLLVYSSSSADICEKMHDHEENDTN